MSGQEHARVTRMDGEREHPHPERCNSFRAERSQVNEQLLGAGERLRIGRFEPAERGDVFNPTGLEGENYLRQIKALYLRQFLAGALEMFPFAPEAKAMPGSRASGPPGALVGGSAADLFDEEGVNAAAGIEPRDAGKPAVDHYPDA